MPLDVVRLRLSELAASATGDEFRAAVLLWCASWHQVPASSLPSSDTQLAGLAGMGRDWSGWQTVKAMAMHGFVLCADGRFYHPVVAEKALIAWAGRAKQKANALSGWEKRRAANAMAMPRHSDGDATSMQVESKEERILQGRTLSAVPDSVLAVEGKGTRATVVPITTEATKSTWRG